MIGSAAVLLLLACAAAAVALAARWLDRPIPAAALAGFLLVAVLPYPRAFVSRMTPLPLDHAISLPPWNVGATVTPYNPYLNDIATQVLPWTEAVRLAWKDGGAAAAGPLERLRHAARGQQRLGGVLSTDAAGGAAARSRAPSR